MQTHLSDERLMDVLDGVSGASTAPHLSSCAQCQARLASAREGLDMIRTAQVPEPSPLFWESFPRKVARRLDTPATPSPWRWRLLPGLATAGLVVAALTLVPRPSPEPPPAPARPLPAWSALPPAEDDAALPVLQALGPELDPALECGGVAECLAELTEEESQDLVQALRPAVKEWSLL